jgi:HlyD family secretion protein
MRRALLVVAIVVVALIVVWQVLGRAGPEGDGRYEFVEVARGDIENVISSTGTLSAVGTVEVGTQVSGTIDRVLVDYNEHVRRGQVLAVLDTTQLVASVRDAEANVLRAQAQYDQAVRDHGRAADLFGQDLISEADFDDSETSVMTAEAGLLSAQAVLDRTRANLGYAVIRSPIDGTVIMRNVEEGQTVAASFSTPTLFVIAEDLSEMEIRALVDESDIGQVRVGQKVRFTVEAYIDEEFYGTVRQIWLQPQTIQNVVNYTVVVDAMNDRGLLFPGMTATADFFVEEVTDVLLVSNAALRFRPTEDMMEEVREAMKERFGSMSDGEGEAMRRRRGGAGEGGAAGGHPGGAGAGGHPGGGAPGGMFGGAGEDAPRLWYLDENGRLAVAHIEAGATDGRSTEIIRGEGIEEGMQVIKAVVESEEGEGGSRNPLATMPFGRRRR